MKLKIQTILATLWLAGVSVTADANEVTYYPSSAGAPFSKAVRVENTLYLSGLIGAGKKGLSDDFDTQITQLMENLKSTLASFNLTTADVFKCTVMIDEMSKRPAFNSIYVSYFEPERLPARSAFGADGLAMGAVAELECMAYVGEGAE